MGLPIQSQGLKKIKNKNKPLFNMKPLSKEGIHVGWGEGHTRTSFLFYGFHTTCHLLINYQLMEEQFNCMAH